MISPFPTSNSMREIWVNLASFHWVDHPVLIGAFHLQPTLFAATAAADDTIGTSPEMWVQRVNDQPRG